LSFHRFPLVLSAQVLLRLWKDIFLDVAGGGYKEFDPHLSGSGDVSGSLGYDSPWGWTAELGVYGASSWHTAWNVGVRYTSVKYLIDGSTIDGSNVGLQVAIHINP
jgi:hypothetical protein